LSARSLRVTLAPFRVIAVDLPTESFTLVPTLVLTVMFRLAVSIV